MSLNDQIQQKMKQFRLNIPYSIRMLSVNEEGDANEDEKVELLDNQLTFFLTPDNSIGMLNELIAKASLGHKYGEILCNQTFNKDVTGTQVSSFYNVTSPVLNALVFKEMLTHLDASSISKEVMEWKMLFSNAAAIPVPDLDVKMIIVSLYVVLVSNNIIEESIPSTINEFKKPITVMLEMAKEEPSPELLCQVADRIIGKTMQTMLGIDDMGKKMFVLAKVS